MKKRVDHDTFVNTPFVYDEYSLKEMSNSTSGCNDTSSLKKMYNRGQIMSYHERDRLYLWASELFKTNKMTSICCGRYEKILIPTDEEILPLVFEIKKRIDEREKLTTFKCESFINDFLAVVPKNGHIHQHTDPNDFQNNLFHIRFNVFITIPPNDVGTTYYNNIIIDSVQGCYVLCRSGIDEHRSRLSLLLNDVPRSVELEEKGSCIYTTSNLLTNAQCDYIANYIESNSSLWQKRMIDNTTNVECKFMQLTSNVKDYTLLDKFIFSKVGILIRKITKEKSGFYGTNDDGYTLCKIVGGTNLHCHGIKSKNGRFGNFVRCLSIIIVLNDDYDGGVFCFPKQGLKFRVQKGQAIMFPPYWTHPHSVTSVGEGQARYAVNTWILEKFID